MKRFICIVSLLFSLSAVGQPALTSDEVKAKAASLAQEAGGFYNQGDYAKSLSLLQEAYSLWAFPGLLYNMALCQKKLSQPKEATGLLCQFLKEEPTTEYRPKIEAELTEINGSAQCPTETINNATSIPPDTHKETLPPKNSAIKPFVLPGLLLIAGSAFGTSALLSYRAEVNGASQGETFTLSDRTKGISLAVSADMLFLASGVTALLSLKKK